MTELSTKWSPALVEELLFRQFIKNEDVTSLLPPAPKVTNENFIDQYEQATKMLFAYVRNGPVATLAAFQQQQQQQQQHGGVGNTPVAKPYQTPLKSFLARTPTPPATTKTRSENNINAVPPLVPTSSSSSVPSSNNSNLTKAVSSSIQSTSTVIAAANATSSTFQQEHVNNKNNNHNHYYNYSHSQNSNNNHSANENNTCVSPSLSALTSTVALSTSSNDKLKTLSQTTSSAKPNPFTNNITTNNNNTNTTLNGPPSTSAPSGLSNVSCINTLLGSTANSALANANAMAKTMNKTISPQTISLAAAPSEHKNISNTPSPTYVSSQEQRAKRYRVDWPAEVPTNNMLKSNSRSKVAHLTAQRVAAQEKVDPDLIFAQNKGELPLKVIFAQFPKALQNIAEIRNASGDWRTDTFTIDEEEEYKRDMKFAYVGASQCTYGTPSLMTQ